MVTRETVEFVLAYLTDEEIEECGGITASLGDIPICNAIYEASLRDAEAAEQLMVDLDNAGLA